MAFGRVEVFLHIHGDPSVGINSFTDKFEIQWDLDEIPGDRDRIRGIFTRAWTELYDDGGVSVHFGDECPDCLGIGYHKPSCPSALYG